MMTRSIVDFFNSLRGSLGSYHVNGPSNTFSEELTSKYLSSSRSSIRSFPPSVVLLLLLPGRADGSQISRYHHRFAEPVIYWNVLFCSTLFIQGVRRSQIFLLSVQEANIGLWHVCDIYLVFKELKLLLILETIKRAKMLASVPKLVYIYRLWSIL